MRRIWMIKCWTDDAWEEFEYCTEQDTKDRGIYEIRFFTRGTKTCLDLSS